MIQTVDEKQVRHKEKFDLQFETCGEKSFNYHDQQEVKTFGIQNFNCLTESDYDIIGNFYRKNMRYLELKLWKCQNLTAPKGVVCKNQTFIDNYFNGETFSFAFVNSMFALDNYIQPIKYFIDDSLFFELDSKTAKKANFYVQ